jgi:hypothetical protein
MLVGFLLGVCMDIAYWLALLAGASDHTAQVAGYLVPVVGFFLIAFVFWRMSGDADDGD